MLYINGEMSRRRKRRGPPGPGPGQDSAATASAPGRSSPPAGASPNAAHKALPPAVEALRNIIERAADRAKSEAASTGKLGAMAFFLDADGTIKAVSLSWRNELQKETVRRRIREKTTQEAAAAVVVLTSGRMERGDNGTPNPLARSGTIIFSGATPAATISARVDYGFDKETKNITSWAVQWLDKRTHNIFLDGVFTK
jgi:hypothetical protein